MKALNLNTSIRGRASQPYEVALEAILERAGELGEDITREWFVRTNAYVFSLYDMAEDTNVDPWVAFVQAWHETDGFDSPRYRETYNPAGLDVPLDSSAGVKFDSMIEAAALHLVCLAMAGKNYDVSPVEVHITSRGAQAFLAKWDAKYSALECPRVLTIRDLNAIYIDRNTGNKRATWAVDPQYGEKMAARAVQIIALAGAVNEGSDVGTKPKILVIAGHRSHGDTGNQNEKNLTPGMARAYRDEFRRAGYECTWLQEADGDTDPDDTVGGLDTVSTKAAQWLAAQTGECVLLDLHFEGSPAPGAFVIVPDVTGLTTGAPVFQSRDDTWEKNTMDRSLARALVNRIASATGLPLRGGIREPGMMDESQTGVGGSGFRLATFAYTSPYRDDSVRLVVEHGNHTHPEDYEIIRQPWFAQVCAAAAVEAVNEVYGVDGEEEPTPVEETGGPNKPGKINWKPGDLGVGTYKNAPVLRLLVEITATKRTVPRVAGSPKAKTSGSPIEVGDTRVAIGTNDSGVVFLDDGSRVFQRYFTPEIPKPRDVQKGDE